VCHADEAQRGAIAYLSLSAYADLRQPSPEAAFRQVRALAAVACLAINVITI
jgi:hypothetical protein